jgi:type VI secretion system protein ImpJ
MKEIQKVAWYEGMMLDPHHFQQWDRHHQAVLNARVQSLNPFSWGLIRLQIDLDRLQTGQFALIRCKGITPDGLPFDMPNHDALPMPYDVSHVFPSTQDKLGIFLALPLERPNGINCLLEKTKGSAESRFTLENTELPDENTGTDPRPIGVARANFQIRADSESVDAFSAIQVAEIIRTTSGGFQPNPLFIPPCLFMNASEHLTNTVRGILELLAAKDFSLRGSKKQLLLGQKELNTTDATVYLLSLVINSFLPVIHHLLGVGDVHPETVYRTLLALAGQLIAVTPKANMDSGEFPVYNHQNPAGCFNPIAGRIRAMLGEEVSTNWVAIPLLRQTENLHIGKNLDPALLQKGQFFLSCSGDLPEKILVDELPGKIRVASPDVMDKVLATYVKALPIRHMLKRPADLPVRADLQYFRLEQTGPFWDGITQTRSISVFLPKEFIKIQIELLAIR